MKNPDPDPSRWVSVPTAAKAVGVCAQTIRRRISDGSIPAYRFGPTLLRVQLEDVERAFRPIPVAPRRSR